MTTHMWDEVTNQDLIAAVRHGVDERRAKEWPDVVPGEVALQLCYALEKTQAELDRRTA